MVFWGSRMTAGVEHVGSRSRVQPGVEADVSERIDDPLRSACYGSRMIAVVRLAASQNGRAAALRG